MAVTEKIKETFTKACTTLAGMGERVLGFVHLDLDPSRFPEGFQFSTDGEEPTRKSPLPGRAPSRSCSLSRAIRGPAMWLLSPEMESTTRQP